MLRFLGKRTKKFITARKIVYYKHTEHRRIALFRLSESISILADKNDRIKN